MICTALIHVASYFLMNEFVRVASNKLFQFHAPWALTVLQDGGSVWSIGAITQFRFFKSGKTHKHLGRLAILLVNLPFLAMLVVVCWIVGTVGIRVLRNDGLLSATGVFTLIAFLLVIYPLFYLFLLRTPFRFTKNTTFIRWNFLTKMYRRSGRWHPRSSIWIAENRRAAIESENKSRTEYLRKKYQSAAAWIRALTRARV